MKKIKLGKDGPISPAIALGCMRFNKKTSHEVKSILKTAINSNINFFDHADIYGAGYCEEIFGNSFNSLGINRDAIIIQSKCGIIKDDNGTTIRYDFSKKHIISSVKESIDRLKCDYLDIFALHRPDMLLDPEEIADAFYSLHKQGLVKYFGVSNQNPNEIDLIQKSTSHNLIVNQLQFGIAHTSMMDINIYTNKNHTKANLKDGEILNYCRLNDITIQAWGPLSTSDRSGIFIDNPKYEELNSKLQLVGNDYNVSKEAMAIAWILRHPANIQVIIGTTQPKRIENIAEASEINITRNEWYDIYNCAGNILP